MRGGRTHQRGLVGLRVFEVDDLQSERLLHFGHVGLTRRLEQRVTLKLVCGRAGQNRRWGRAQKLVCSRIRMGKSADVFWFATSSSIRTQLLSLGSAPHFVLKTLLGQNELRGFVFCSTCLKDYPLV